MVVKEKYKVKGPPKTIFQNLGIKIINLKFLGPTILQVYN